MPEMLSQQEIFRGRIFGVTLDEVREDGLVYRREVVQHPGGAGVVALFDDGTVALVKQYRHPTGRYLLELPAGRLEPNEPPEQCAARELEEEVGARAGRIEKLAEFFTTPGFCAEKLYVYLATGLTEVRQNLEDEELVEVLRVPFREALAMCANGAIEDAKTIIGLMLAAQRP
jgi:ADP-ribose pyrophosphatase